MGALLRGTHRRPQRRLGGLLSSSLQTLQRKPRCLLSPPRLQLSQHGNAHLTQSKMFKRVSSRVKVDAGTFSDLTALVPSSEKEGNEKVKLIQGAGEEIAKDVTEMEKFYGINEDDDSGNDDADPDAEVDGMAAKLAGWEKRKLKYEKYAEKGKPEKLEKAMEKQRAKLQKATDKGKPQEYLMYKAEKIEFTQKMWTLAHLVANMKRAGFLPQC